MARKAKGTGAAAPSHSKALRDHIVARMSRIADAMRNVSAKHIKDRWNLRDTDFRLMNVLDGEPDLSVNELGRRALVDQAWVSRSLHALEALKLIERRSDPHDSRLTRVSLTKKGRETIEEYRPYTEWSEEVLLDGVDGEQLKQLLSQVEANTERMLKMLEHMPREPRKKT
jgi:DNA-binding MarR family transcriptional regulator